MKHDLRPVMANFEIAGDFVEARSYGSGHINDTYAVTFNQAGAPVRVIAQRINHTIFTNPPELMDNVARVTRHIRGKLIAQHCPDVARRVLNVVPALGGQPYHRDGDGNFWRVYHFIEGACTFDKVESPRQAYEGARAFGAFLNMLVDLPGPPLHDTLPNFHNGPRRYRAFEAALAADAHNRAASARPEIDFLQRHGAIFDVLPDLVARGEIPVRIAHNDTKINNVLLDSATGEGICVIDLDTVMSGVSLYDFGDLVRSSTSPATEDERDLGKVAMRMEMFEQLVRGFLSIAGASLNRAEREHLVLGGKMMTLIMGARFLTDYLAGDTYYKIARPGHNLDRCRTQFKLIESIIAQEDAMRRLVEAD